MEKKIFIEKSAKYLNSKKRKLKTEICLTIGTICPVKLYVTTFPTSGSVSVHSSSCNQTISYATWNPKIIKNKDPTTVYSMNKKKYRWFAKPTQLFIQAEKEMQMILISNWVFFVCVHYFAYHLRQWWSIFKTHLLHMEQWCVRVGFGVKHFLHMLTASYNRFYGKCIHSRISKSKMRKKKLK